MVPGHAPARPRGHRPTLLTLAGVACAFGLAGLGCGGDPMKDAAPATVQGQATLPPTKAPVAGQPTKNRRTPP